MHHCLNHQTTNNESLATQMKGVHMKQILSAPNATKSVEINPKSPQNQYASPLNQQEIPRNNRFLY